MRLCTAALFLFATTALAQTAGGWVDDCGLQPPGSVPFVPVESKLFEPFVTPFDPPVVRVERTVARVGGIPSPRLGGAGALSGKVIYLSPGHGFTWDTGSANWRTQRPTTNTIVEDLVSIETLSQYVMPMLLNAGAFVVPVRELDLNPNLVIVDNGEAGYVETGAGFSTSSLMAWGRPAFPMNGDALPFTLGTNRLLSSVNGASTASATWTATIPADGTYDVQISYTAFTARVTDAHFIVKHAGGDTHFRVNQQRHGGTWVTLGRFFFKAGPAQVIVQNDSTNAAGSNISLDAVKFGGGMGLIDRGGGVSGRPRFEESSRYQAQWAGAPSSVWAPSANTPGDDRNNDVGTRSRFAAWVHEPGEDAVYVAWHTNAFNASAVGTTTYCYGPNPPDGTLQFTGVDGGLTLANLVHAELINDIKQDAGWNQPTWRDRGVNSAYFGELNPANNGETPSILIEVAFHDAAADALHLKEPNFRYLAARSITQGLIKFFAQKDGVAVRLPPEPPTHVAALNQGNGEAVVQWRASPTDGQGVRGQAATGYRVYSSDDGRAWDDGVDVTGTNVRLSIPATAAKYFRVTAVNAGGESFPSTVVGVKAPVAGKPLVLLVNGFDRMEAAIGHTETFAAKYALGDVLRIFLSRINDGAAARVTGRSLDVNGVGFDTADTDAVSSNDVNPAPYQLLTWLTGTGKQGGVDLTAAERAAIQGFRTRNLPVFFHGAGARDSALVTALSGTVGATASAPVTAAGPIGSNGTLTFDDGTQGAYEVPLPLPVVNAAGAAVSFGTFANATNAGIGVQSQSVVFGFPFEAIVGQSTRDTVMGQVLAFLAPAGFDGGVVTIDAGMPLDAGVSDAGQPGDDAGTSTTDAGTEPDGGTVLPQTGRVQGQVCDSSSQCLSSLTCRFAPREVVSKCLPVPVLAFQGGGCSSAPVGLVVLALAFFARRRRR
ncbi:MAG: N-acetylmuramoyl-L-alanine amidase [Myxococcaceae bacterium]